MLSQIIQVILHLCGQGNLITTVWKVREFLLPKQSGNPVMSNNISKIFNLHLAMKMEKKNSKIPRRIT